MLFIITLQLRGGYINRMPMNSFYQKLTRFGTMVNTTSRERKMDMANYFTVLHPAYPVFNDNEQVKPAIQFSKRCPSAVKREVAQLWKSVFGV